MHLTHIYINPLNIYIYIISIYRALSIHDKPVPVALPDSKVVQILVSAAEKQLTLENFEALAAPRYGKGSLLGQVSGKLWG